MKNEPNKRGPLAGHSLIHMWGLFAATDYRKDQMIIEYQGELIKQPMPDWREKRYEALDIDSCYIFMVNQEHFVDSTQKGNASRFINHSCDPNCYTKIIDEKIVIIAKTDIPKGTELTYDYCFSSEEERISCSCGSEKCSGRLN
jgi:SET domain-containing protein